MYGYEAPEGRIPLQIRALTPSSAAHKIRKEARQFVSIYNVKLNVRLNFNRQLPFPIVCREGALSPATRLMSSVEQTLLTLPYRCLLIYTLLNWLHPSIPEA
jgi:hypothetical protein